MLSSGHVIISAGIESGLYGLHYFVSLAVYPCAVSVLDGDEPKTSTTYLFPQLKLDGQRQRSSGFIIDFLEVHFPGQ